MLNRQAAGLLTRRLHNQRLDSATPSSPDTLVAWLGAVQAQDYAGAKWALGLRGATLTDAAVEAAFTAGTILRTHLLRPTWHFVTPSDIRWMLALTAPRVHAFNRPYYRTFELDADTLARSRRIIRQTLAAEPNQTRTELATALGRDGIEATGTRLALVMMDAELEGLICSGPRRGKQFTYALLDVRAPHAVSLSREEALAELTRRYFASHGPASVRDFAWWSGLTAGDARTGIASVHPALEQTTVDAVTYWATPSTTPPVRRSAAAHLLPNYDEYLIAYQDRGLAVPPNPRLAATSMPEFAHQLIVGGRLAGSWRRTIRADAVIVEIQAQRPFTPAEDRALIRAAQQYARFLDTPVTLVRVR